MKKEIKPRTFSKADICGWNYDHSKGLLLEDRKMLESLERRQANLGLVLKYVDEEHILIALIYDRQVKNSKKIRIAKKIFWVKFSEFLVIPVYLAVKLRGREFSGTYEMVSSVYDSHNRYLRERRKQRNKKKEMEDYWEIVLKESEKNRDEYYRMRAPMEEIEVPNYLSKNAMYPYSGGGVSPR